MRRPKRSGRVAALIAVCFVIVGSAFVASGYAGSVGKTLANAAFAVTPGTMSYTRGATTTAEEEKQPAPKPNVAHITTPDPLKAIYMTQCVVGTPSFRDTLVKLIDETEL